MRPYNYGDFVIDREAEDPTLGVVVNCPPAVAEDWDIDRGRSTVAADNPDYSPTSRVVVIVHWHDLQAYDDEWEAFEGQDRSLAELADAGVPYYAFPAPRLRAAPETVIQGTKITPTPATAALQERLEAVGATCTLLDEETIRVEKFTETYQVRPGEFVEGTGLLEDRLRAIVEGGCVRPDVTAEAA